MNASENAYPFYEDFVYSLFIDRNVTESFRLLP